MTTPPTQRHAQAVDSILRRLHRVLETVGPKLEEGLARTHAEVQLRQVHLQLSLEEAEQLRGLYYDGEPWPLQVQLDGLLVLGALGRVVRAAWSLGWHHPDRFLHQAKAVVRRSVADLEARLLDRRVFQAWWRPPAAGEDGWQPSGPGDAQAYPVTVWPLPLREQQEAYPTVYL